ncbi:undecaprenyldiphospho-muramoylpentapeptide beta-N-acetylglucosaminyltransferase [Pacificimonas sp. WHA3]|uniref:UDP-N-acetylglucosamine--N-acetylmuramyl-(pentapeptide) pyrophosphoryl-undecaprenol N-acetylglucosamine transferase n=1 Tax=Pacificimonas pallii TaxID=2827236 RepID=A0ABS6SFM3_9SPHN|nr:undecaprenyldiphospho-muramoylpentapeptide beta-N-acetylglucosaminyltransferase [Pacificimonas pallii]MBV7257210.1 undecaprenyldiphospho-muramoylpentapeptide beta-N-acetylglucosaminyltransferase [Pacificimonas pallii]
MKTGAHYLVAAGGTGGHMVPAHAVARELERRGARVSLITDARGARLPGLFGGNDRHIIDAASIGRNPLKWPGAMWKIAKGRRQAAGILRDDPPAAVIGFGGYPVLPAMIEAAKAGIPTLIHEQNAVLGRVNRVLQGRVDAIATSFVQTSRLSAADKADFTGNPVRGDVAALARSDFPLFDDVMPLRVLVLGGSLGATVLSEVVPRGLAALPEPLRQRLQVMQQAREEDIADLAAAYRDSGIPADLSTYMEDVPAALARAHLFIGRAGASTIAELTAAGRPAILVPLPIATDDHQAANTAEMVAAGGAVMLRQDKFTPEALAAQIAAMVAKPETLANAAARAKSVGRPDAAIRVADMAERLAGFISRAQESET